MTRDDIWDDSMETIERRNVIYAVLGYTLSQIDILLHMYCPLHNKLFVFVMFQNKDLVLLEHGQKLIAN